MMSMLSERTILTVKTGGDQSMWRKVIVSVVVAVATEVLKELKKDEKV